MLDIAIKLLNEITSHSYQAYIVGGFVRDYLLGIDSNDIDITTNATPKQIREIFSDSCLPNEDYGSITVVMKGIRFEITTFRQEIGYIDNRKPAQITYIDDLYVDLLRRDFTINTLCMDKDSNIIDRLNGRKDLENKVIKAVGDADLKFSEDSLRILRAVRFATIFDFDLDDNVILGIGKNKHLITSLSYYRKKMELEKIFTSPNYKKGIQLILDLGLDKELELTNLEKVLESDTISLIGIWSLLNVTDKYPFNKNELDLIKNINKAVKVNNLDPYFLYKYGLYVNSVAGEIKKNDIREITEAYNNLTIKDRSEIDIDSSIIMNILNKEPGKYLKDIYEDIEKEILYKRLNNNCDDISMYISYKYK